MLLPPNSIAFTWSPLLSTEMGERATFFALRPKLTIRITYPPPMGIRGGLPPGKGWGGFFQKGFAKALLQRVGEGFWEMNQNVLVSI